MRCVASLPGYWSMPDAWRMADGGRRAVGGGRWMVTNAGLLKSKAVPASPPARQPIPYRSIARAA